MAFTSSVDLFAMGGGGRQGLSDDRYECIGVEVVEAVCTLFFGYRND